MIESKLKISFIKQSIKEIFQKKKKKRNDEYLRKLVRILNDKEKYCQVNGDDFNYYGIIDISILFNETSKEDYYKPIFVKGSYKDNYYKYYESTRDIEKKIISIPIS